MADSDIILFLRAPYPQFELRYPGHTLRNAVDTAVEQDFFGLLLESFGPPAMTHELFELDIAEGWYLREHCLVMYNDEEPVAAGQVHVEGSNGRHVGFIDTLGVPKRFQGRGYGLELTKRRIRLLAELGVDEIRTEVEPGNGSMLSILKKLDFVRLDGPAESTSTINTVSSERSQS
jgi:ribosomal protein S18 acetylase RimI-like enzyme